MLLAQEYVPDLSEYKDRFMRTPLGLLTQGNVSGAVDELGTAAQGRVQAMMNPESALQTGFDFMGGGILGQTAYHGTPHIFSKFDASKVGTGEGAQLYGHGLYFADNPITAQFYATKGANKGAMPTPPRPTDFIIDDSRFFKEDGNLYKQAGNSADYIPVQKEEYGSALRKAQELFKVQNESGSLYKVDIPDEYIPKMLDFDKPLYKQSDEVKQLALKYKPALEKRLEFTGGEGIFGLTGSDLFGVMQRYNPGSSKINTGNISNKDVTKMMQSAGIPGSKYLDQGSRNINSPNNTLNYVVFDPTNVKILERK